MCKMAAMGHINRRATKHAQSTKSHSLTFHAQEHTKTNTPNTYEDGSCKIAITGTSHLDTQPKHKYQKEKSSRRETDYAQNVLPGRLFQRLHLETKAISYKTFSSWGLSSKGRIKITANLVFTFSHTAVSRFSFRSNLEEYLQRQSTQLPHP